MKDSHGLTNKLVVLTIDGHWLVVRDVTSLRGHKSRGQPEFRVISHMNMYSGTTHPCMDRLCQMT